MSALALIAFCLAAVPAALFLWNLFLVVPPRRMDRTEYSPSDELISVLIPARNEAERIGDALDSVLSNTGVNFEVIVLDDHSTDGTAERVEGYAVRDSRVRLYPAPDLSAQWCGKQHACHVLAARARGEWLVFMDADVRLASDALSRMRSFMQRTGAALGSGVPRQVTGSFLEKLMIPLVHFVLLGFLPVWRMRRSSKPAYAAGCGQLFIAQARAYENIGGHASIRQTLHDGIKLPRAFRRGGYRTDLFDATDVARCRMYTGAQEVVEGLMKNAHEALAAPAMIVPMSLMLLGGQVLPWVLLLYWPVLPANALDWALWGAALGLLPRWLAAWRFRQSLLGALFHPVSVALFVVIQWCAFFRLRLGHAPEWRGRAYPSPTPAKPTFPRGPIRVVHPRAES